MVGFVKLQNQMVGWIKKNSMVMIKMVDGKNPGSNGVQSTQVTFREKKRVILVYSPPSSNQTIIG